MGRLSDRQIHFHHASEIGLEGVERGLRRGPILTVSHGVELLLRVGQCPNLLLTLGAEIPQMGRHDGNWRVRHQKV